MNVTNVTNLMNVTSPEILLKATLIEYMCDGDSGDPGSHPLKPITKIIS
jgi:hypothetical protein